MLWFVFIRPNITAVVVVDTPGRDLHSTECAFLVYRVFELIGLIFQHEKHVFTGGDVAWRSMSISWI